MRNRESHSAEARTAATPNKQLAQDAWPTDASKTCSIQEKEERLTPDIIEQLNAMIRKSKNVRSHIRKVTIVRDVHSAMHLAAFQTAVQECTVLNIIREDKEAGQAVYAATAAGIRDRNSAVLNTVQQEADTPAGQTLVAFGTVIDNRSCVTNETAGDAAVHSTTTVAQKGDAYNITSFIKEEKH